MLSSPDELPQTVTVKEDVPAAPSDTSVKAEPLEPQEKPSEEAMTSPPPPPPSVTIKPEVKKEEPEEEDVKDEEDDDANKPCTKMTMRLRRNLNNPQCVSRSKDTPKLKIVQKQLFYWTPS